MELFRPTKQLTDTVLRLYDSSGNVINEATKESSLVASSLGAGTRVGAFPLLSQIAPQEPQMIVTLGPGAYTATIGTESESEGDVMIEIYYMN